MTKQEIAEMLRDSVRTVTFTKTNGETRVMKCTLMREHLPEQTDIEEFTSKSNDDVLPVWDMEASGWRSFRIENVKDVE